MPNASDRGQFVELEKPQRPLVFYLVGLPRSGSTFVGDWIARSVGAVNVGESWQTLRTIGLVDDQEYVRKGGKWQRPDRRAEMLERISSDEFWSSFRMDDRCSPYRKLLHVAAGYSDIVVDCSKVDYAIPMYRELGCDIRVVHVIRAFSTWSRSVNRYRAANDFAQLSSARLLYSYFTVNRLLSKWQYQHPYRLLQHDKLKQIETELKLEVPAPRSGDSRAYRRFEMFGTDNFVPKYDDNRAAAATSLGDSAVYRLLGFNL